VGSATGELLEWLERSVFPEEGRFHDEHYARAVAREFTTHTRVAGTTTLGVFSSSSPLATEILFEALAVARVRAQVGLTLMDHHCPRALRFPPAEALSASRALVARWHGHDGGRLRFAVTPRFALSCSRELMEQAARLANDEQLVIQTHLAENPTEDEATLRAHPWASDYLDVYDRVGLLTDRTRFAHAVHLPPAAWDRIERR